MSINVVLGVYHTYPQFMYTFTQFRSVPLFILFFQEASVPLHSTLSSSIWNVLSFREIPYVLALDKLFMFQVLTRHWGFNLNYMEPDFSSSFLKFNSALRANYHNMRFPIVKYHYKELKTFTIAVYSWKCPNICILI
jgi:hypothetical protein